MFPSLMMSCHVPIDPCHLSLTHVSLVSGVWSLARHILDVSYARCKRKLHLIISLIYNNDRLSNCWKLKRHLKLNINFINFEKIPWIKTQFSSFFSQVKVQCQLWVDFIPEVFDVLCTTVFLSDFHTNPTGLDHLNWIGYQLYSITQFNHLTT